MRAGLLLAILAMCPAIASAQDTQAGQRAFQKCSPCHAVGPDARNKVGPILNGLAGRKSGTVPGYSYSAANKASGITWTEKTFADYIRKPQAMVPGTKMPFAGIRDEAERRDLWAYLAQFGVDGRTLPPGGEPR